VSANKNLVAIKKQKSFWQPFYLKGAILIEQEAI
jgi:hypothetical protein